MFVMEKHEEEPLQLRSKRGHSYVLHIFFLSPMNIALFENIQNTFKGGLLDFFLFCLYQL